MLLRRGVGEVGWIYKWRESLSLKMGPMGMCPQWWFFHNKSVLACKAFKARANVSDVFLWFSRFSLLEVFLVFSSHDHTFQVGPTIKAHVAHRP